MIGAPPCLVCLVTARTRLDAGSDATACCRLVDLVGRAVQAGVDLIQIRERDLDARLLRDLAGHCISLAAGTSTRVLVNERIDVALAAGAAGVHLRADSYPAVDARRLAPRPFLVGRSVHDAREAGAVAADGTLDYLIFGTVFTTRSKPVEHRPTGAGELASAVRAVDVPVLAIGGVTLTTISDIARAGAAGFAGIGFFLDGGTDGASEWLSDRVAEARRRFDSARASS